MVYSTSQESLQDKEEAHSSGDWARYREAKEQTNKGDQAAKRSYKAPPPFLNKVLAWLNRLNGFYCRHDKKAIHTSKPTILHIPFRNTFDQLKQPTSYLQILCLH
ncbi:hypothetical protein CRENBAI_019675 [Crenichthys baileyi]|uniref:Uncharacterized protein n=1 Tax=Crenichthys baileyi TaxID=28760 RepID=A0AAV9R5W8_9TELE